MGRRCLSCPIESLADLRFRPQGVPSAESDAYSIRVDGSHCRLVFVGPDSVGKTMEKSERYPEARTSQRHHWWERSVFGL